MNFLHWYAPLAWPGQRYEWWLNWHYWMFNKNFAGPWYHENLDVPALTVH